MKIPPEIHRIYHTAAFRHAARERVIMKTIEVRLDAAKDDGICDPVWLRKMLDMTTQSFD